MVHKELEQDIPVLFEIGELGDFISFQNGYGFLSEDFSDHQSGEISYVLSRSQDDELTETNGLRDGFDEMCIGKHTG